MLSDQGIYQPPIEQCDWSDFIAMVQGRDPGWLSHDS